MKVVNIKGVSKLFCPSRLLRTPEKWKVTVFKNYHWVLMTWQLQVQNGKTFRANTFSHKNSKKIHNPGNNVYYLSNPRSLKIFISISLVRVRHNGCGGEPILALFLYGHLSKNTSTDRKRKVTQVNSFNN